MINIGRVLFDALDADFECSGEWKLYLGGVYFLAHWYQLI